MNALLEFDDTALLTARYMAPYAGNTDRSTRGTLAPKGLVETIPVNNEQGRELHNLERLLPAIESAEIQESAVSDS